MVLPAIELGLAGYCGVALRSWEKRINYADMSYRWTKEPLSVVGKSCFTST